jgi:hypothetical protein
LSFADHSEKFAWYASLNGNESEYGLEPPTAVNLHNQAYGGGGFTSLIYNASAKDQLRLSTRAFASTTMRFPTIRPSQDAGIRDRQREQDVFSTFTWVHTFSPGMLMTFAPFYHFNRAAFEGGPSDAPSGHRQSRVELRRRTGIDLSAVRGRHNFRAGLYAFAQQDNTFFSVFDSTTEPPASFQQRVQPGRKPGSLVC